MMADALQAIGETQEITHHIRAVICTDRIHATARQLVVTVCALHKSHLAVAGDHVSVPVAHAWVHLPATGVGKAQDQGDRTQSLSRRYLFT